MVGDDAAVQASNDDATQSKQSCVALGYFQDDFVRHFVRTPGTEPVQGCILAFVRLLAVHVV